LGFCIMLCILSRLLEEPSLTTTLKDVYFIYILLPLHVSALVGHLQAENTQLFQEATSPTTDPLFCVIRSNFYMLVKFCHCQFTVHL
jgi:hypothetical protein